MLRGLSGTRFVCRGHRFTLIVSTTPPPQGKNKSDGFVIIIQNSAIDFCCKAKAELRLIDLIPMALLIGANNGEKKAFRIHFGRLKQAMQNCAIIPSV